MKFLEFVLMEAVTDEAQLSHLEHVEDHAIHGGEAGFHHAISNLEDVHHALSGHDVGDRHMHVSQKLDGSPSIIAGHHPKTGKFFVATKSAFNKEPKINYSEEDVDKNHGHAPGLASKLKLALKHLPKTLPKHGVYQGDVMHSREDRHDDGEHVHFKPNTITYSIHKDHPDYHKANSAHIGVAFHTKYEGTPDSDHHINGMHATFTPDHHNFKPHSDVHLVSPNMDVRKSAYTPEKKSAVEHELRKAKDVHENIHPSEYAAVQHHEGPLKTYINSTVRTGETPSHAGYRAHLHGKLTKAVNDMKSAKGKESKQQLMDTHLAHVDNHKHAFTKVLQVHKHLQNAKNHLVDALSTHQEYTHSVNGERVKPEGFVVVKHGRPSKFVDRNEFSKLNFENNRGRV